MLSVNTQHNINTLKNLSTKIYWDIKEETDKKYNTQWNTLIHNFNFQYHKNFYWRLILQLYKCSKFYSKPSITYSSNSTKQPAISLSKNIIVKSTPEINQATTINKPPKPLITKPTFSGCNSKTPTANFLQFMKSKKGLHHNDTVSHKQRNEWKEEENFDPKIYNSKLEWFNWIENNMILP